MATESVVIRITGSYKDQITSGVKKTIGSIKTGLGGAFRSVGTIAAAATKTAIIGFTALAAAISGVGIAAFKMAKDLNTAMANVATLIPQQIARIKELRWAVRDFAIETGKSTGDLAGGLYQVVSAFGDSAASAKMLEIAAKAGKAGVATTLDAINLISAVTKAYDDTSEQAAQKTADLAFQAVKLGKTTFPELAGAVGNVTPLAHQLHIAQEELFAGFATLTGVTGEANTVSTQFAAILRALIKPTDAMTVAIHKLGFSGANAMTQQLGLVGSLNALLGTTNGTEEAVAELFGRAEALTAVFALAGPQAAAFTNKLNAMKVSAGVMEEAFREQTRGINRAGHQWDQLKQIVITTAQAFGDEVEPAISTALGQINAKFKAVYNYMKTADLGKRLGEFFKIDVGIVDKWERIKKAWENTVGAMEKKTEIKAVRTTHIEYEEVDGVIKAVTVVGSKLVEVEKQGESVGQKLKKALGDAVVQGAEAMTVLIESKLIPAIEKVAEWLSEWDKHLTNAQLRLTQMMRPFEQAKAFLDTFSSEAVEIDKRINARAKDLWETTKGAFKSGAGAFPAGATGRTITEPPALPGTIAPAAAEKSIGEASERSWFERARAAWATYAGHIEELDRSIIAAWDSYTAHIEELDRAVMATMQRAFNQAPMATAAAGPAAGPAAAPNAPIIEKRELNVTMKIEGLATSDEAANQIARRVKEIFTRWDQSGVE